MEPMTCRKGFPTPEDWLGWSIPSVYERGEGPRTASGANDGELNWVGQSRYDGWGEGLRLSRSSTDNGGSISGDSLGALRRSATTENKLRDFDAECAKSASHSM